MSDASWLERCILRVLLAHLPKMQSDNLLMLGHIIIGSIVFWVVEAITSGTLSHMIYTNPLDHSLSRLVCIAIGGVVKICLWLKGDVHQGFCL